MADDNKREVGEPKCEAETYGAACEQPAVATAEDTKTGKTVRLCTRHHVEGLKKGWVK